MTDHLTSADVVAALAADGPFTEWTDVLDATADPHLSSPDYEAQLAAVREKTGLVESVRVGEVTLGGHRVAVVVSEFAFLGGSIGERAARIVAGAVRKATALGIPVVASPVSGGTRMQEGAAAFLQLATIGLAIADHKAGGLGYLVYLRSPTTGGVLASWASLGHVTVAQPDAFIAFLGPRVVEAITGQGVPDGVQRAENLQRTGIIDRVSDLPGFVSVLRDALAVLASPDWEAETAPGAPVADAGPRTDPADSPRDAWADVVATRAAGWPGILELVATFDGPSIELVGPSAAQADGAAYVSWSTVGGHGVVVVGFRGEQGSPYVSADDLARVRLAVTDAVELGLPVVAVIDLVGGELTAAAEEAGIAREIARSLAAFVSATVPTVAVLLGKGSGGAAFAIGATDAVVALQGSWLAPLQPEGASAIVNRDAAHADVIAREQGITAQELARAGYVDEVVDTLAEVSDAVARVLTDLSRRTALYRHDARVARYSALGT